MTSCIAILINPKLTITAATFIIVIEANEVLIEDLRIRLLNSLFTSRNLRIIPCRNKLLSWYLFLH